ncbi:MAG: hypothetical protein WC593_15805 [Methanoregula sp.]
MDDHFPELFVKYDAFKKHFLAIPDINAPFAKIRYKMAPKMIPIGAFWIGDRLPDGGSLVENEKKPCFGARNKKPSRRPPT